LTNSSIRYWIPVDEEKCELEENPFECPECHGHVKLDVTYFEQVDEWCACPYCTTMLNWPVGDYEEDE
jgi:hypothetical protein